MIAIVLSILLFGAISAAASAIHFDSVGSGQHDGYITAIDQGIWGNYTVYFKTNPTSSQEDKYCISKNDQSLFKLAKQMNDGQLRKTIQYHGVKAIGIGICNGQQIDNIN
jgi:hypothetical protein